MERFNFYGISGIFDANDPSYGVWQFKTRFGGFVEELPGKFTLPVDGLRFGVSEAAHQAAASLTNSGEHGHRNKAQVTTR